MGIAPKSFIRHWISPIAHIFSACKLFRYVARVRTSRQRQCFLNRRKVAGEIAKGVINMYVFAEVGPLTDGDGFFLRLSLLPPQLKLPAYYGAAPINPIYFIRHAKARFRTLSCERRSPIQGLSNIIT